MLAGAGYAYVLGLLAVLIGSLFAIVMYGRWWSRQPDGINPLALIVIVVVAIALSAGVRIVVSALMVDIPVPEGSELRRDVAPELYKLIDELCEKLRTPRFQHVMISTEFNAGIRQCPRFGLFGGSVNYLWIGIPLLKSLTPEQFRAVLAHELGHISGNHSRFRGKIYHLSETWTNLLNNIKGEANVVHWFARWYAPYFHAYTFTLRRSNEFDADKCAAEVSGPETAATALVATATIGRYLEEKYWPSILDRAGAVPEPDVRPFTTMLEDGSRPDRADQETWYREALEEKSGIGDTHPCLSERLEALGFRGVPAARSVAAKPPLPLPEPPAESAATRYLGEWLAQYTKLLDDEWTHKKKTRWRERYEDAQIARDELQELIALYQNGRLDERRAGRFAVMAYELDGAEKGIALVRSLAAIFPSSAPMHMRLGYWLLESGDESGVASLNQAMVLEPKRNVDICRSIGEFYARRGEKDKAGPYEAFVKQNAKFDGATPERIVVKRSDRFIYHSLPPDVLTRARLHLGRMSNVKAAYVVQRQVREHPEKPTYIVVIEPTSAFQASSKVDLDYLAFEVIRGLDLPGDVGVEFAVGQLKWLKTVVSEMRSSKILG